MRTCVRVCTGLHVCVYNHIPLRITYVYRCVYSLKIGRRVTLLACLCGDTLLCLLVQIYNIFF